MNHKIRSDFFARLDKWETLVEEKNLRVSNDFDELKRTFLEVMDGNLYAQKYGDGTCYAPQHARIMNQFYPPERTKALYESIQKMRGQIIREAKRQGQNDKHL